MDGGAATIRESRKAVYFCADLRDLQLGFANYIIGSTGEYNHGEGDVEVKFGLEYGGKFYPFTIAGQRSGTCSDDVTLKTDPLPVTIKAGTYGAIRTWERKLQPEADHNKWLWSTAGDPAFNEGNVFHSDPARDWTLGGSPGETAAVDWTRDESGAVTPRIVDPGHDLKTGGATIGILDSQRLGSGFNYVATNKDGGLGSWYSHNGGAKYSADIHLSPTGMGGYGGGGAVQTFGPSVIVGTPEHATPSVLLLGDSIAAGFGASDKRGDTTRNFGIYARAFSKKYNVCNAAIPGLTAYACDYSYKRTRSLIADLLKPQIVLIALGTNDVDQAITDSGSKKPAEALQGHLKNLANWWQEKSGSQIWLATILPRVKRPTEGTPGPKPGFETGAVADTVNSLLRNGQLLPGAKVIDGRALTQDPADNAQWRTDAGKLSDDGTHPNDANGIPWIAAHLVAPEK